MTNGSYDRKRAPTVSGARWLVFWTKSGRHLARSFFEYSSYASLYHGELLGLLGIRLLVFVLEQFYQKLQWQNKLCCDNFSDIKESAWLHRRDKTWAYCTNLLRSTRNTKNELQMQFVYKHIDSHMDQILLWYQLTLEKQINYQCN